MERITIVGMGPVGASIGLALKRANLRNAEVVGTGRDKEALATAQKMGALDKTESGLRSALRGAQLVILDTTLRETKELLENMGPLLEDGTLVTDTGSLKGQVLRWADEYLPSEVNFIGGHPLSKRDLRSLEDAHPDAFRDSEYCLVPGRRTDAEAMDTMVALIQLLGARPFFMDEVELDSYAAATKILPVVLSSALVTSTSASESWREIAMVASTEFRDMSSLAANDPEESEMACRATADLLVHWIDQIIGQLYTFRNKIKEDAEDLLDAFVKAWEERARWEAGTAGRSEERRVHIPTATQTIASMFVPERLLERQRQAAEKKKEGRWRFGRR